MQFVDVDFPELAPWTVCVDLGVDIAQLKIGLPELAPGTVRVDLGVDIAQLKIVLERSDAVVRACYIENGDDVYTIGLFCESPKGCISHVRVQHNVPLASKHAQVTHVFNWAMQLCLHEIANCKHEHFHVWSR